MLKRFYFIIIFIMCINNIYASDFQELSIYGPDRFGFSSNSIQTIRLYDVDNGPKDKHFFCPGNRIVQKGNMKFNTETLYKQSRGSNPYITIDNDQQSIPQRNKEFSNDIKLNISTYGVARLTLDSYKRFTQSNKLDNLKVKLDPSDVNCQYNAYYQHTDNRTGGIGEIHFCAANQSPVMAKYFDVVAHETGHSILDALQLQYIYEKETPLQYSILHESFADLSAIFSSAHLARIQNKSHELVSFLLSDECLCIALGIKEKENCLRNTCIQGHEDYATCEAHDLSINFTRFFDEAMKTVFRRGGHTVENAQWTFDFFQKLLINNVQLYEKFNNSYDFARKMINQPLDQAWGYTLPEVLNNQLIKDILNPVLFKHKTSLRRICSTTTSSSSSLRRYR